MGMNSKASLVYYTLRVAGLFNLPIPLRCAFVIGVSQQMESSDIRIDKEGVWYFKGAHMFRKEILCVFFEHLQIDECGKYLIELGEERCYLDVEDTAFVVAAVYKTKPSDDGQFQIDVLLSDDSCEKLEMNSLYVGERQCSLLPG